MVAIKDMEMLKSCWDCPILCKENGQCERTKKYIYGNDIPSDCPLVEIEERKIGKWIEERDDYGNITGWHCSNCYDKTGFFTTCKWDYCPNCGSYNQSIIENER